MADEEVRMEKVWGEELWIVNSKEADYCMKELTLRGGYQCSDHHHKKKDETFYVVSGRVYLKLGDEERVMNKGDRQRVRRGQVHCFASLEDTSVMIEASSYHDEDDSYRGERKSREIDLDALKERLRKRGLL